MSKKIRVTHTITLVTEIPFDERHYPEQYPDIEAVVEYESELDKGERGELFAAELAMRDPDKEEVLVEVIDVPNIQEVDGTLVTLDDEDPNVVVLPGDGSPPYNLRTGEPYDAEQEFNTAAGHVLDKYSAKFDDEPLGANDPELQ